MDKSDDANDGRPRNIEDKGNYQTVKSTFIMGGSSAVNIILGIIRHKVIALLLSSSGIGLLGVYQSLSGLASTIFGLGINESGARQVAISFRSGDERLISRTALALRRTALITGILGTLIMCLSSKYISLLTFKSAERFSEIWLVSLTILLGTVFGGQTALIQGARKISYLAKINVIGSLLGTLLSLPVIYLYGMRAVVSYLVILSATNVISSWWYSRKIIIPTIKASWRDSLVETKSLVGLGTALMVGSLFGLGSSYIVRILIIRRLGLDGAGVFQASSILSSVYVGILFKAMATDYYPRLSAAHADNRECSILVNQQIEAGLLMAVPGIILTLTFAPFVIIIFYSKDFLPAVDVLRWQVLGVLVQVMTWSMGYLLRAKAAGKLFIATEFYSFLCYIAATWLGIRLFGLVGSGMAYFAYNVLYMLLIYPILYARFGFKLNKESAKTAGYAVIIVAVVLSASYLLPKFYFVINSIIAIGAAYYAYRTLGLSEWFKKVMEKIRKFKKA